MSEFLLLSHSVTAKNLNKHFPHLDRPEWNRAFQKVGTPGRKALQPERAKGEWLGVTEASAQ